MHVVQCLDYPIHYCFSTFLTQVIARTVSVISTVTAASSHSTIEDTTTVFQSIDESILGIHKLNCTVVKCRTILDFSSIVILYKGKREYECGVGQAPLTIELTILFEPYVHCLNSLWDYIM